MPRTRFLARENPISDSVLFLSLDTAIAPLSSSDQSEKYAPADTAIVVGVRRGEQFTAHCYTTGNPLTREVGALSSVGRPDKFEHPRLAWRFDTVAKRIRRIDPGSVYCTIIEPD